MKNKFLPTILFLCALMVISSCKKKIETCKIGRYYATDGTTTTKANVFTYNSNGQVIKINYTNGGLDSLVRIADTLRVYSFGPQQVLLSLLDGITTANRLNTASKTYYDITGAVTGTEFYTYEYNAEGNLTKRTAGNAGGTSILSLSYAGGSSTSGTLYNGISLEKKYVFFHNTIANKTGIDDLTGIFSPYLGKPSSLLLDSMHVIFPATSDTTRIQYTHTLDGNDYVSKTVETFLTPGVQTTYHSYQYFDCQ